MCTTASRDEHRYAMFEPFSGARWSGCDCPLLGPAQRSSVCRGQSGSTLRYQCLSIYGEFIYLHNKLNASATVVRAVKHGDGDWRGLGEGGERV